MPELSIEQKLPPAERRLQVYQLLLKQAKPKEIASLFKVSEDTIDRDVSIIRRSNLKWYRDNRTLQQRMENLFKEQIDAKRQVIREAWVTYSEADKPGAKAMALSVVLNASRQIDELLGFAGLSMLSIELQEKLEVIDAELRGLRELANAEKSSPQPG